MIAPALADDSSDSGLIYFISVRAPSVDPAPRYISASPTPVDGKTESLTACDGETYYLSPGDAAAVRAAVSNSNTVQLQVADVGEDAAASRIVCLIQASP